MRDFLLAPFFSLFSPLFYRRLFNKPLSRGFLYLAYLSLWVTLGAAVFFRSASLPAADDLIQWLGKNLPEVLVTKTGLQMSIEKPLLLTHPRWGEILYLDPTTDSPKGEDLDKALVVITRQKAAYRNPAGGDHRIQDLVPQSPQKNWQDFLLTGEKIILFWTQLKPILTILFLIAAFIGTYLWKLAAGLFYSLAALFLNLFRKERLSYGRLLNVTFFALTPATFLQLAAGILPFPVNFPLAFIVTGLYLALGILGTQDRNI